MNYKILEEKDLAMMLDFVDDENTRYNLEDLRKKNQDKVLDTHGMSFLDKKGYLLKNKDRFIYK
jgi:hypothetical protein